MAEAIPILVVTGQTAGGKERLAAAVARALAGEIVSADSMKVYRGMDVGTAKASPEQRRDVPHHLLDVADPAETFSTARWLALAEEAVADIHSRGRTPVVSGGTPLYLKALLEGLFKGPAADPAIRARLKEEAQRLGAPSLHARLARVDAAAAARIHPNDLRRITRALEVWELTGTPISDLQHQWGRRAPRYRPLLVAIRRHRDDLTRRIAERVGRMLEAGLVDEVRRLASRPEGLARGPRQALGYAEVLEVLDGRLAEAELSAAVVAHTRQFARRQMTWLSRFEGVHWLDAAPGDAADALAPRVLDLWREHQRGADGGPVSAGGAAPGPAAPRGPSMTPRERFLATLTFGSPDRVPFSPGGPRESTLAAWRTQGLPPGADWHAFLLETLGLRPEPSRPPVDLGVDFRMVPQFEEKVLERRDGHLVVQDWKGNVCEISDRYDVTYLRQPKDFVTRRWLRCPVGGREDWEAMKARYAADAPGRFPEDFAARCRRAADAPLVVSFPGPFWQMREWCGLEPLCILMIEQPEFVDEMAAFWTAFVARVLERVLGGVVPDMVHLSEDMAYKAHPMISPAMAQRFCGPSYEGWSRAARGAGVPLVGIDSDGYVGHLLPLWMASGVNVCDPMEAAAHNDLPAYRRRFGRAMAYQGGVDKRAIARGGEALEAELARLAPVVEDGGYIPGCDHGVPADVSWPRFVDYSRRLAEITGWL